MDDIVKRINEYLTNGGLFNPEYMNHEAMRDLLIECRDRIDDIEELLIELSCECPYHCEYDWVMHHCPHKKAAIKMRKE